MKRLKDNSINNALFVAEWGTGEASGNGALNFGEVGNWTKPLEVL